MKSQKGSFLFVGPWLGERYYLWLYTAVHVFDRVNTNIMLSSKEPIDIQIVEGWR